MIFCPSATSCKEPMKAGVYMMAPGAIHHLSAKVLQWNNVAQMRLSALDGHLQKVGVTFFCLTAVNCPLPKAPTDGQIVYDKPVTGTTTTYGQGWTYECNRPKAPSYERGSCMADGTVTEPPVCQGERMFWHSQSNGYTKYGWASQHCECYLELIVSFLQPYNRGELPYTNKHTKRFYHLCCDETAWLQGNS